MVSNAREVFLELCTRQIHKFVPWIEPTLGNSKRRTADIATHDMYGPTGVAVDCLTD
jgi:hypothetical protein